MNDGEDNGDDRPMTTLRSLSIMRIEKVFADDKKLTVTRIRGECQEAQWREYCHAVCEFCWLSERKEGFERIATPIQRGEFQAFFLLSFVLS